MIDTSQLTGAAGIHAGIKNSYLIRLLDMVQLYNGLPSSNTNKRIEALDTIMLLAGEYLTSKTPNPSRYSTKNTNRWNAIKDLAEQCGREAQALGVKQLSSPTDFRNIRGAPRYPSQCYWLERMDPFHRPGYQLSALYETWVADLSTRLDFWTYAGGLPGSSVMTNDKGKPMQVKLLDDSYRAKRIKYEATFVKNGCIEDFHGAPFTTFEMCTVASGKGWGIFVLSPDNKLYLHAHKLGRFHHSSFLGGAATAAAGEMVVDMSGCIRIITAKTGHYRSGVDEMLRLVRRCPIDAEALILPDVLMCEAPPMGQDKALFYRVGDFRARGTNAKPVSKMLVNVRTPNWARTPEANSRWFHKVP